MKKGTLALAITLTAFGSIPAYSSDDTRWKATDPYLGKIYELEHVSTFAKVSNGVITIASGLGMIGYAGKYVHDNYETTSFLLPYLNYSVNNIPTLNAFSQTALAMTSLFVLGIPTNMFMTYGAKKGATLFENVATYGWDVFKYGFNSVKFRFDHFRATHLQGTLWHNTKVNYVEKAVDLVDTKENEGDETKVD